MSNVYQAVLWNRHKRVYDAVMLVGLLVFLGAFVGVSLAVHRPPHQISPIQLLIRAFGSAAILLLHVILLIGPLVRLFPRFLPLLYNRRHLGVTMFLLALTHAVLAVLWYHAGGEENPLVSIFTANTNYSSLVHFPYQTLGFGALVIIFLMAATSHDFWLKNLSPSVWKALHMGVYVAYGLLILHVALGALQTEKSGAYPLVLGVGFVLVAACHLVAARRTSSDDRLALRHDRGGWLRVGPWDEIPEARARIVAAPDGERIAVFLHDGAVCGMTNVCAHQNGPLGEGRVVDGCVTCPWHGYQYRVHDGQSPPPYTEKVATHRTRVDTHGVVYVELDAQPPGTAVTPAPAGVSPDREDDDVGEA